MDVNSPQGPNCLCSSCINNKSNLLLSVDSSILANLGAMQWNAGNTNIAILDLGLASQKGNRFASDSLENIYEILLKSLPNNPGASYQLGVLNENGWGVERSLPDAQLWYQMANISLPNQPVTSNTSEANPQEDVKQALRLSDGLWGLYSVSDKNADEFAREKNRLKLKLGGSVWAGNSKLSKILKEPINITSYIEGTHPDSDGFMMVGDDSHLGPIFKRKVQETYGYDIDSDQPCLLNPSELKPICYQEKESQYTWELDTRKYIKELIEGRPIWPLFESEGGGIGVTTKNHMGDICSERTYIIDQYEKAVGPRMSVLDIGTATGKNAYSALKKGAFVTALDLELEHLNYLFRHTSKDLRNRLWLNTNPFPERTDFLPKSKKVILMSHVAHYLSGENFVLDLKKFTIG